MKKLGEIKGVTVEKGVKASELVKSFACAGFQATELAKAVEVIKEMRREKATVFLSFTSNMVSCGLRELFAQLLRERFVDAVVTNIGSVEEDFIKTQKSFLLGDFFVDDAALHHQGINRIGNVFVPNDRYEWFEQKIRPFFKEMLALQKKKKRLLSASEMIYELGKRVKDKQSFLYWATRNKIPIFCPAPTDGAFGLQTHFFKQDHPEFGLDATADMKDLANVVVGAKKTGAILLGGGAAKHHVIGANIVRGGLDYAVYVTTATQYDGSLSGARVNEGVSWGKVSEKARFACVEGDASIMFPLILAGVKG